MKPTNEDAAAMTPASAASHSPVENLLAIHLSRHLRSQS